MNGIQEASGSIPLISTNDVKNQGFANWQSLDFLCTAAVGGQEYLADNPYRCSNRYLPRQGQYILVVHTNATMGDLFAN